MGFAKRQVTWLKRDKEAFLVHPEKLNEMKNIISNKLKELNKAAV